MTEEIDVVETIEDEAPSVVKKKVAKKKAAKKPEVAIPCDDCKSRNICKAQGYCKHV